MGERQSKVQVCRRCGNEKSRTENNGRYTYFCHCLAWREYMGVLAYARAKGRKTRS
jgi:hypothetical protein